MRRLSRQEVAEIAATLGHDDVEVEQTVSGRRFMVRCSCGWGALRPDGSPSVTTATLDEAVARIMHHLTKSIEEAVNRRTRDGVPLPDSLARVI